MDTIKISAVLIVKNEQKVIERCLRSVKDFDEIVVLDTGSTDRTMEIAREMGAKVSSMPPEKPFHFARARNAAHDLATNDWCMAIDADEVLRTGMLGKIRKAIREQQAKDPLDRISGFIITFTDKNSLTKKKKVYCKSTWNWRWRCHEQLYPLGTDVKEGMLDTVIMDHLPLADGNQRRGQNVELLKITIEETPEYTRAWKHLGQELMLDKAYRDAIPYLEHFVEKTDEGPLEKSEVMMRLGQCQAELKQYEAAIKWFEMAAQTDPRRREPLYHGGRYLMLKNPMTFGDLVMAADFLRRCLSIPVSSRPGTHVDQPTVWGREPERMLAVCQEEISKNRQV
jgi:glycosyltransferase involved in cell wall biosynthesis